MHVRYMRFVIAAITTMGAFAVYVSRVNLSIAIIAMVEDSAHDLHETVPQAVAQPVPIPTTTTSAPSLPQKTTIATSPSTTLPPSTLPPDFSRSDSITSTATESSFQMMENLSNQEASPMTTSMPTLNSVPAMAMTLVTANRTRAPLRSIFPAIKDKVVPLITQTKFKWDQTDQGNILGAFFYGYILFQIPGARIAETLGARWIIMASSVGSCLVSLTFPMATQLNSIHLLMMLRFVMGLCQSAFFPAAYVLFCRWLPESERSILLPIMFIGSNMGSISTYIASSYLITSSLGWPSVFYVSGMVCLVVSILWCIFGSSEPSDSMFISDKERIYIEEQIDNQSSKNSSELHIADTRTQNQSYYMKQDLNNNNNNTIDLELLTLVSDKDLLKHQQKDNQTAKSRQVSRVRTGSTSASRRDRSVVAEASWSKLIRSVPVWTLVLSMYGNEWSNVVLCYELPTYLNTALEFPIEQNGVINSFFQLAYAIASPIMSALGAYLLERHLCGMAKIHLRKTFQSLATFGQLLCFVSVPICGANRGMIILLMFSAIIFRSCSNAGDIMVPGDLSPDYAGTIFAFANSVGNTAGFFAPLLVGVFVESARDRVQWTPFWLTTAAIMGFSGLIFLIFGEVRHQDFDRKPKKTLEKAAGDPITV